MIQLKVVQPNEIGIAMELINQAKQYLKEQGIDQWQNGYPDFTCIEKDIAAQKGYFLVDGEQKQADQVVGYLCIDFQGEPAYANLKGSWLGDVPYVVVHRLAIRDAYRGKGFANLVFDLVEALCNEEEYRAVQSIRVDTDKENTKMQHVLKKNGFVFCGTIWFDNSEKIAFEKLIKQ